jgi:HK97 family phage prohead protease
MKQNKHQIGELVSWSNDGVSMYGRVLKNNEGVLTVRSFDYDEESRSLNQTHIDAEVDAKDAQSLDSAFREKTTVCERREFRMENASVDGATIRGYASVFNKDSEDLGGFTERIAPGAFSEVLNDDVRCYFNHDSNLLLGRTTSGTLRLSQDSRGLFYECDLPNTSYANDLTVLMERGDVTQSSFGFFIGDDVWEERDGVVYRTILKVSRLLDVSPVSMPAYPDATSEIKRDLKENHQSADGAGDSADDGQKDDKDAFDASGDPYLFKSKLLNF